MTAIAYDKQLASACLLATLSGCVAPGAPTPQPLSSYSLPAPVEKAVSAGNLSSPTAAIALAVDQSCYEVGISVCRTAGDLRALLGPLRPSLLRVNTVNARCDAGHLEATLHDATVDAHDQQTLRQGRVDGHLRSNNGLTFRASGEFTLVRYPAFDQLSVTFAAPAIAGVTVHYSQLRENPDTALLSFKVERGLLGAIFGVPTSDTGVHVPVHPKEGGLLCLCLGKGENAKIVEEAEKTLPQGTFKRDQLAAALDTATPFAVFGYEPAQSFPSDPEAKNERIRSALTTALRVTDTSTLPPVHLLCNYQAGNEEYYEVRCLGVSPSQVYVVSKLPSQSVPTILTAFQSIQLVSADAGIFCLDKREFKSRLLNVAP